MEPDSRLDDSQSPSTWQNLPPLQARAGVTALAGQVLKLDGTPLAHVKLQIGAQSVFSDGTGRFLLKNLAAGHNVMMIFADSANTPQRKYGVYEVGVDIKGGITNVLSYVVWMTPLDTAHAVKIPSPTTSETVITSPLLPGLELHLPANTVITDAHGNTVTEITITPVPLDRTPFPLPHVPVPIYFTIQPGAAYIKVTSPEGPHGARLFYPNPHRYSPGTPFQFWNYDAGQKGWFVYGGGRVSADRSQIIPNPGVEIYEFTGAMVSNPGNSPGDGPRPGSNDNGGDPVDLATGLFVYQKNDLVLPDLLPLALTRTYRQNDPQSRAFGVGTSMPYDMFMVGDNNTFPEGYTFQDLILADGGRIHFQRISPCTGPNGYCDFGNAVYENTSSGTDFHGAIIREQGCSPSGFWTLTKKDGTVYCFPDSDASNNPRSAAPTGMRDRYGNSLTFTRDGNRNLTQITSPDGRWIQFTYDASNRITQAKDNIGRTVSYSYDAGGRLTQVIDANGGVWNYTYDAFSQMTSVQDARGIFYLTNQYDQNGRVIRQTQGDNSTFLFSYLTDPITGNVTQTDVTDPRGIVNRTTFTANGYSSSKILALGRPEQQTVTYNRDPNTNLVSSMVDPLSRTTSYTYDALGNLTGITRLAGTPSAVSSSFTYEPAFNQIATVTDPLNHTTTFSYDGSGNLITITDPLGHQAWLTYNGQGLPISITDPVGNSIQMGYDAGDLVSVTDALGNTITRFWDSAGRLAAITNAAGQVTRFQFNPLNELLQMVDPLQQVTSFNYDPNGNLLSRTDPLGHATSWTYNNMERVIARIDPLLRQETYTYDPAGNLISTKDRKGLVTTYGYDNLNRMKFVGFGTQGSGGGATYQGTITYQYDAVNRPTQSTDSSSGIITDVYDGLDRVVSESTPQGSISYGYDAAGRRISMTVSGQPPVSYTFDNANRLTQISQATASTVFSYDDAGRRTAASLPNGVNASYTYDNDSHLTGIIYSLGGNPLGNFSYGYDVMGRRNRVTGSFARTGIPQPISTASYDAANQLINWNGVALAYDANGNMLSDGTNTFTWDARGQLAAFNATSLGYDALGRRVQGAGGTSFLYDGINLVQQLSGTTPTANLLTGGVDQFFTQADSTGVFTPLRDVLGSTVALTDASGNLVRSFTYDPFGNTAATGTGATPFQYTGRENDGTGLYYYRARYYSPALQRFISEDPLGPSSFDNLYAYSLNSPLNLVDPHGTCGSGSDYGQSTGAGAGVGTGVGMGDALNNFNQPDIAGNARLGFNDPNAYRNWNRTFHFDWDQRNGYHFNADSGPLSGFNHAPIPDWMYKLGNTDVMSNIGRGAAAAGIAVDAYHIITAGRKQRPGAIGGALGGWGGAEVGAAIGTAIAPGIGTIIGGIIGGVAGGALGQAAGDQVSQSMYGGCNP
jgi:RHS repeat-associated protein